jgi:hypothetical protein
MAASKKKSVAPAAPPPNRSYEHGAKAFGAKYVKKGFALTDALDLHFALGHGSPMGPATLLPDLDPAKKIPWDFHSVHRNVALAELRAPPTRHLGQPLTLEANPAPLERAEGQELLRKRMPKLVFRPVTLRAIEAMIGPSAALEAWLDGLESMPEQSWNNGGVGALFFPLYGLLLRTPPSESNAARARLEALYEKKKDNVYGASQLNIMLHGRAGIATDGYKYSLKFKSYQRSASDDPSSVADALFVEEDSAWVASQFAALWAAFKFKVQNHMNGPSPARLFFLGGDAALETELKVVDLYPGTKQPDAFESYKDLKSPLAVELIKRLANPKSKVKKQADAWLAGR